MTGCPAFAGLTPGLHRPDFDHVGHEVAQQILDAVLEGRGGRRAARAGALHVEIDNAFLVATECNVAAVAGDRRPDARLDQVLDGCDGLGILGVEELVRCRVGRLASSATSGAPDIKCSMMAPRTAGFICCQSPSVLVTAMKSDPKNTPPTLSISNSRACERRLRGGFPVGHVERAAFEHGAAGKKFQRRRVWRGFGLDEHRGLLASCGFKARRALLL